MGSLLDFPNELLLLIYGLLGDIDDVLHLAQSCRHLHSLLESGNNRIGTMRSIIANSDVYKYDIRLCQFIDTNQAYYSNYTVSDYPPAECRPDSSLFTKCSEASEGDLTDDQVWSIVCRWQGLRLLQDLYLHPSIRSTYLQSVFPYWWDNNYSLEDVDMMISEGPIEIPESRSCYKFALTTPESMTPYHFDPQQTQRFYQALTACWLTIEALRLADISKYNKQSECNSRYDELHSMWLDNNGRTLRESFDVLEVYDFVQGFLVRKIFADVDTFPEWIEGEDIELLDPFEWLNESWDYFVKCARLHLRPSDIIELFLMSPWREDTSGPLNKVEYLRWRGMFDEGGVIRIMDTGVAPDPGFSLQHLETDVALKLMEVDEASADVWPYYRSGRLVEGRATALWWAGSDGDIVDRIKEYGTQRNDINKTEAQPHISGEPLLRDCNAEEPPNS